MKTIGEEMALVQKELALVNHKLLTIKEGNEYRELWSKKRELDKREQDIYLSAEYKTYAYEENARYKEETREKLENFLVEYRALCEKHHAIVENNLDDEEVACLDERNPGRLDGHIEILRMNGWNR